MLGNFFWPFDEKIETRTSCNNWNDGGKRQQEKTVRKDIGWTDKVAKCRKSDRCTKGDKG